MVANTFGWTASFPVVGAVSSLVRQSVDASTILPVSEMVSEIVDMAAIFGVMGGVPAVITEIVLTWLMRRPKLEAYHPGRCRRT